MARRAAGGRGVRRAGACGRCRGWRSCDCRRWRSRIDADLRQAATPSVTAELQQLSARASAARAPARAADAGAVPERPAGRGAGRLPARARDAGRGAGRRTRARAATAAPADPGRRPRPGRPQPPAGAVPGAAARVEPGAPGWLVPIVPRQLPATVAYFTGRAAELRRWHQMLDGRQRRPGTVVISRDRRDGRGGQDRAGRALGAPGGADGSPTGSCM